MSEISFGTRALHTSIERVRFSSYLPKVTRKNFDKPRIVDTVLSRKNFGSGDFRRTILCRTRLSLSLFFLSLSFPLFLFRFPLHRRINSGNLFVLAMRKSGDSCRRNINRNEFSRPDFWETGCLYASKSQRPLILSASYANTLLLDASLPN